MPRAVDVARYIVEKKGAMTAMKLQKLVYYAQAWSLVWDEKPLFDDRIEAWANGPVVRSLYAIHRLQFTVDSATFKDGDATKLSTTERETVDAVLEAYGDKPSQWLVDLTHSEAPWKNARGDLSPSERGRCEITPSAMLEYYGSIDRDGQ